ncbi:hypothetical protein BKK56_01030 [Rodentibacter genomosp. 2]|uniref:hypothetical protein n=1 Tax=Rodentibacter genomosp. 2 TaxID=1908266 RepID=UPI0009852C07|nr:hypothetical protein BKK56_01030 [Rodentibacter genomosp. 2]
MSRSKKILRYRRIGSDKKIYKEFLAEEFSDGKKYIIQYPYNFKLDKCMYYSKRGQLYIEEKSKNLLLNEKKYSDKTENYRKSIVRGENSGVFTLVDDKLSNEIKNTLTYLNKLDYNIFCHKIDKEDIFNEIPKIKSLMCSSASIENGTNKLLTNNEYTTYTIKFWENNPKIHINFKVSSKIYCTQDEYCEKNHLMRLDEKVFDPKFFPKFYQKGDK